MQSFDSPRFESQRVTVILVQAVGVRSKAGAVTERKAAVTQRKEWVRYCRAAVGDLGRKTASCWLAALSVSALAVWWMTGDRADFSSLSLDWFFILSPVTEAQALPNRSPVIQPVVRLLQGSMGRGFGPRRLYPPAKLFEWQICEQSEVFRGTLVTST